ncbi:MAG: redoxin domain-containing protein [Bacteroidales bacterium]|nr:redoxin domain-containing protein [Bacteroidales bacterium]
MRTLFFALLIAAASLSTAAAQTVVHGHLIGFEPSAALCVNEVVSGNKLQPRDTVRIDTKGSYSFSVQPAEPTMYVLSFTVEQSPVVHLIVLPKEKDITLDLEYKSGLNVVNIKNTKGSKNAELYKQFNEVIAAPYEAMQRIDAEYSQPGTSDERKRQLAGEMHALQLKQRQDVQKLIVANKDCLMSAFLVTYFEQEFATYVSLYEEVRDALIKNYAGSPFVKYIDNKVRTSLEPGTLAPEIDMKDPDGKQRKLSDLRGKVVMIDFWASWCGPCRRENPNVVKLYHRYHDKGFEIYSVSLDKDRNAWLKAIQDDGLVWPNHVSDLRGWTSSGGATYGIMSVPSTVLVDRKGRIIAKNLRGEELADKLKELFGF